jgi:leucyl/phenylalanyl-tRNA--protein transferase
MAIGADLAPGTVLAAYRRGLFPMAVDGAGAEGSPEMAWWSPAQRGVLQLSSLRVSHSMRQSARRFEIRIDTAFAEVVAGCADPSRSGAWIDETIAAAYTELHELGWAHSVEAWHDGELAGGLYGLAIGGLFAGESMFTRVRDASKVSLMALVEMLGDEYAGLRLLDTQWQTPHLASLGVDEIPRQEYLQRLEQALGVPLPAAFGG